MYLNILSFIVNNPYILLSFPRALTSQTGGGGWESYSNIKGGGKKHSELSGLTVQGPIIWQIFPETEKTAPSPAVGLNLYNSEGRAYTSLTLPQSLTTLYSLNKYWMSIY